MIPSINCDNSRNQTIYCSIQQFDNNSFEFPVILNDRSYNI